MRIAASDRRFDARRWQPAPCRRPAGRGSPESYWVPVRGRERTGNSEWTSEQGLAWSAGTRDVLVGGARFEDRRLVVEIDRGSGERSFDPDVFATLVQTREEVAMTKVGRYRRAGCDCLPQAPNGSALLTPPSSCTANSKLLC